jgi:hypothetical protein
LGGLAEGEAFRVEIIGIRLQYHAVVNDRFQQSRVAAMNR